MCNCGKKQKFILRIELINYKKSARQTKLMNIKSPPHLYCSFSQHQVLNKFHKMYEVFYGYYLLQVKSQNGGEVFKLIKGSVEHSPTC